MKKFFTLALLSFSIVCFAGNNQRNDDALYTKDAPKAWLEAKEHEKKGNVLEMISCFEQVLEETPATKENKHRINALNRLIYVYSTGIWMRTDTKKADKYVDELAELDDPAGLYVVGLDLIKTDPKKAYKYLLKSAEQGHPEAIHQVALYHAKDGIEPDKEKLMYYLRLAGEHNHTTALVNLGQNLRETNPTEAIALWEKAASIDGNPHAYAQLGTYYLLKEKPDVEKAIEYFQKGVDQNDGECQSRLAGIYISQKLDNRKANLRQGLELLLLAISNNYPYAKKYLANNFYAIPRNTKIYDPMLRPIAYLLLNDLDDKEANDLRMKMLDKNNPEKLNHNDMVLVEAIY